MSDETQQRIFNEIANKCGLLTQNHFAFLSSDNITFRYSLSTYTTGLFKLRYLITWCVWVFVDSHTIHIQSKSRYTKTLNGDYSISQLSDAIEDINKFIKEIKLYTVKERLKEIEKDFV